jgi:hypothetical protein
MTFVGTREQLGRHSEAERLWAAIQHIDKGKLAGDAWYRQRLNACAVDLEVALDRSALHWRDSPSSFGFAGSNPV